MKPELYEAFLVDGVPVRFEPVEVYWHCARHEEGKRLIGNMVYAEGWEPIAKCPTDEPHGRDCHWALNAAVDA